MNDVTLKVKNVKSWGISVEVDHNIWLTCAFAMISVSGIYLLIVFIWASCNFTSSRYVFSATDGWTGGSQFDFTWKGCSLFFPWKIYCGCICLAKALKSFNNSTLTWTVFVGGWTDHLASYISRSTTEILIHSFVRGKLDFCNSLLFGAQKWDIVKLQSIQNVAFQKTRSHHRD